MLTYLPEETVGSSQPWPAWVHSDEALVEVGQWLRGYHDAVAGFIPPPGAQWRPGDIVGHNDAAPYNAVWRSTCSGERAGTVYGGDRQAARLVGFIDWDFAAPCSPIWDLAFVLFSWVPLHARDVVAAEGWRARVTQPRSVQVYGFEGQPSTSRPNRNFSA